MIVRGLVSFIFAFAIAGCMQAQLAQLKERCDFSNDPRFVVLRGKVPLSPTEVEAVPSLAQISNINRPTSEERAALLELDQESTVCAQEGMKIVNRIDSSGSLGGLYREARLAIVNQSKLLADRQITYGQFRSNQQQIMSRVQQVAGELARAKQMADAASQQAAAANLSSTVQAFQAFNRQPTVTNCNRLGSNVTCVTN